MEYDRENLSEFEDELEGQIFKTIMSYTNDYSVADDMTMDIIEIVMDKIVTELG
jgi:hypothetical protein